eukprot:jgi/Botrbrau1/15395/Bobra.43_2s0023.1
MYREFDLYQLGKEDTAPAAAQPGRKFAPISRPRPTVRPAVPQAQVRQDQGNPAAPSKLLQDPQPQEDSVIASPPEQPPSAAQDRPEVIPVTQELQTNTAKAESLAAALSTPNDEGDILPASASMEEPPGMEGQGDQTSVEDLPGPGISEPAQMETNVRLPLSPRQPPWPPSERAGTVFEASVSAPSPAPVDESIYGGRRKRAGSLKSSSQTTKAEKTGAFDSGTDMATCNGKGSGKAVSEAGLKVTESMWSTVKMSEVVSVIQQQERETQRKERAAKLEAARLALQNGSPEGANTSVQPYAPPQRREIAATTMVFRDGRFEAVANDMLADAHDEILEGSEAQGPILVNSGSFSNRISCHRWSHSETILFYRALLIFGQDYFMMGQFFPGRQRKHLKNKFKAEERANPDRIETVMRKHIELGTHAAGPLTQAAAMWRERVENGSSGKDVDEMALELRNILMMEDVPGLPEACCLTYAKPKKKSANGRGREALPPHSPAPLLLELPSWPPQEKRPRRACVARATYNYTFSDGSESDRTIDNPTPSTGKRRRRSTNTRFQDYVT